MLRSARSCRRVLPACRPCCMPRPWCVAGRQRARYPCVWTHVRCPVSPPRLPLTAPPRLSASGADQHAEPAGVRGGGCANPRAPVRGLLSCTGEACRCLATPAGDMGWVAPSAKVSVSAPLPADPLSAASIGPGSMGHGKPHLLSLVLCCLMHTMNPHQPASQPHAHRHPTAGQLCVAPQHGPERCAAARGCCYTLTCIVHGTAAGVLTPPPATCPPPAVQYGVFRVTANRQIKQGEVRQPLRLHGQRQDLRTAHCLQPSLACCSAVLRHPTCHAIFCCTGDHLQLRSARHASP